MYEHMLPYIAKGKRTQGIECFNFIQQPLFKLQFHPHTIWPKNDFCELPSKTPHDQYHSSDTVHYTLFHIVRDLLHPIMILILTIIMILILITTMMIIMMATYFFLIVGDEG